MYNCLQEEYFADVLSQYEERRKALVDGLNKLPNVRYNSPEGAFYLIVDLPVDSTEKFQYFLLEEFDYEGETVMITPAEGFYVNPEDGMSKARVAYVINPADITRAMEVLGKGIEAYNNRSK